MEHSRVTGLIGIAIVASIMISAIGVLWLYQHRPSSQPPPAQRFWDCVAVSAEVGVGRPFGVLPPDAQVAAINQHEQDQLAVRWFQTLIDDAERLERKRPDDPDALELLLERKEQLHQSGLIERAAGSPQDKRYSCAEVPHIPRTY